jgi:DNA polymerase-3 subunit gamma/tau
MVLARKYRPRNFVEIVGQEHVVRALGNALQSQRLHHAYLFTGTRGVGKTTISRILAKSLNCLGADGLGDITDTPCGVCPSCQAIDAGCFVDYTELDAASNRGVEEVQSLLEQAVYKPVQGRFKVFMIDEVHMLSNTAFNAMLKTLEEPPGYLKFVLATTDPQKVPVTVLSRCLQFNLRPMAPQTIEKHLSKVFAQEQIACDTASLQILSRAARGSMRDALSLSDQAIAFGSGVLEQHAVGLMLGAVDRNYVFKLLNSLVRANAAALIQGVDELRLNGLCAYSVLEELVVLLQRMAVFQVTDAEEGLDAEGQNLRDMSKLLMPDATQLLYSICLHGRAELGLAPDEYAALTMVLLRFFAFALPADVADMTAMASPKVIFENAASEKKNLKVKTPDPVEPEQRVQQLDVLDRPPSSLAHYTKLKSHRVEPVPLRGSTDDRQLAHTPVSASLVPTDEGDFWFTVVQQLMQSEAITTLTRELALHSQLLARDARHWMLRLERESLNSPTSRQRLTAALVNLGHDISLSFEVGRVVDSPAKRLAFAAAQKQQVAEQVIYQDPWVQQMMRDYEAKIIPGSIQAL